MQLSTGFGERCGFAAGKEARLDSRRACSRLPPEAQAMEEVRFCRRQRSAYGMPLSAWEQGSDTLLWENCCMNPRSLSRDDAVSLLNMWNGSARFDPLTSGLLDEKVWGDDDFQPDLSLVLAEPNGISGFIMGVLRHTADGPRGIIKLAAVAGNRRREGIGSRLLAVVEERLAELGADVIRVCESAPNYLTPGVDCRYSAAPHFFESHGYVRTGEACNMTVDLEARSFNDENEEQVLAGQKIDIRQARTGDSTAIERLLEEHWPSWQQEVNNCLLNRPVTLYLALRGREVLAFSAFDANNKGTGWFGPMGTAPEARGRGIGRLLLFRCLSDIAAQGHRYATIPWVDPVGFYQQFSGAAVSRIFHRYEKEIDHETHPAIPGGPADSGLFTSAGRGRAAC
jgi:GNAT superfamily N-acetyltransferase